MKAITIKQPFASLIAEGIKDIENRTWPIRFRGRVLIHASAKPVSGLPCEVLTDVQYATVFAANKLHAIAGPDGMIIGSVEIVDCVINHTSVWAEKNSKSYVRGEIKYLEPIYNWVLANPINFPEPIPAKGKLSFWDYPNILAAQEEKYGPLFCHCQLPVSESNQVIIIVDHCKCRYCGGIWYK